MDTVVTTEATFRFLKSIFTKMVTYFIIFLHGLGHLTCSGIDALPSKAVRLCLRVFYFLWEGYQPIRKTLILGRPDKFVSLSLASLLRPVRPGRPYQKHKVTAGVTSFNL